jgi:alpha-galactosidase
MKHLICLIALYLLVPSFILAQNYPEPSNSPAEITWDGQNLTMTFNGTVMLQGRLENPESLDYFNVLEDSAGKAISQVVQLVSRKEDLLFTCTVYGSAESFPCEAERKEDAVMMVRHSVGLSHSLLNRAVYDRRFDWLLSADYPTEITITPEIFDNGNHAYLFELTGRSLILRFRPHFYQVHKGLDYFEPWNYPIKEESVAGWCSWFAFFNKVTEDDIHRSADMLAEVLVPFGLEYLQIDDGYQQVPIGEPERWLVANDKFPSGMKALAEYIQSKGMKPGIWTNVSFANKDFVMKNPGYFVQNDKGEPAYGSWVGYVMDGSNNRTIEQLITPVYSGFYKTGWEYFKVDALRHLRYEGYNSHAGYYEKKGNDREDVFRDVVKNIRKSVGRESYMMGCWGIRPELIGLIDACRIGDDGFGYGGLAEYNSFNNVVWRNDPDHIELTPADAWKSCMVTSLTGSLFMVTDKPEVYRTEIAEAAKRTLPVLFTRPGQVYEVDPSRIANLGKVDTEVSGGGPRSFDADQAEYCHLYLTEINKEFENWIVLGRTGEETEDIGFSDLGYRIDKEYLVFEFWTKSFLGLFRDTLTFPEIDTNYHCQLFCIREKQGHPQVLATNRHISCGGFDLEFLSWSNNILSGTSSLTADDPYDIYIYEPDGFTYKDFTCEGAEIKANQKKDGLRVISLLNGESGTVTWEANYQ